MRAYLSLGSNLGDRAGHLAQALRLLAASGLQPVAVSSVYETEPQGRRDQPWFLNCVAEVDTRQPPHEVLSLALAVERTMGRRRSGHWGPRNIDVDVLWYEGVRLEEADLTLPHPRMCERAFVLVPLAELAPGLRLQGRATAADLAVLRRAEGGQEVRRWGTLPGWPGPSAARSRRWPSGGEPAAAGTGGAGRIGDRTPADDRAAAGPGGASGAAGPRGKPAAAVRPRKAGAAGDTRARVLASLCAAAPAPLSGARLAETLGVSRAAVWKHVRALRAEGYAIRGAAGEGYAMDARGAASLAPLVAEELGAEGRRVVGRTLHLLRSVDSTNRLARELGLAGSPDGTVVLADEQTAGRGRHGRSFLSPLGGVYLSALLRPRIPPAEAVRLTLLGAVAVCEALEAVGGLAPVIKWPNDVLLPQGKVCGVLLEMVAKEECVDFVVLGCGLNVVTVPPLAGACSLWSAGAELGRGEVARAVLDRLDDRYAAFCAGRWSEILAAWRKRSATLGREVAVTGLDGGRVVGRAVDVTPDGALLLDTTAGPRAVLAGDVEHLR